MLSPRDIRNLKNSFKKKSFGGGYDTQDVDQHLASLAERWESVLDDRRHAEEKVTELEGKLQHYEKVELALQEALETARDTARRTEESADRKARLIIDEAELRAQRIVQEAEGERYGLRQDLSTLTNRQNEVAARLRGFLMSELEILAQFQGDDPVGFIKLVAPDRTESARSLESPIESPRLVTPDEASETDVHSTDAETEDVIDMNASAFDAPGDDDFGFDVSDLDAGTEDDADLATIQMASPTPTVSEPSRARPVTPTNPWPDADSDSEAPNPWSITPASPEAADASDPNRAAPDPAPAATPPAAPTSPPAAPGWSSPVATFPSASGEEAAAPPASGDAPNGWSLRSLVTGESDETPTGSQAERDKIRRILDDLD